MLISNTDFKGIDMKTCLSRKWAVSILISLHCSARESIQTLLQTCEASDGPTYVTITIDFVKHFTPGGVCFGTKGPVTSKLHMTCH